MEDYTKNWKYSTKKQNLRDDTIRQIAEDLQGTCRSMEDVLDWYGFEHTDLNAYDWLNLVKIVRNCDGCGWWYEVGEMKEKDHEFFCQNCIDERE